jgi:hypothetical protein
VCPVGRAPRPCVKELCSRWATRAPSKRAHSSCSHRPHGHSRRVDKAPDVDTNHQNTIALGTERVPQEGSQMVYLRVSSRRSFGGAASGPPSDPGAGTPGTRTTPAPPKRREGSRNKIITSPLTVLRSLGEPPRWGSRRMVVPRSADAPHSRARRSPSRRAGPCPPGTTRTSTARIRNLGAAHTTIADDHWRASKYIEISWNEQYHTSSWEVRITDS